VLSKRTSAERGSDGKLNASARKINLEHRQPAETVLGAHRKGSNRMQHLIQHIPALTEEPRERDKS
jgi:hypothetical protein